MKKHIIIVAGGKGLRMGGEIPKQFLPVAGKPVLEYILELLAENGCDDAVIAVHYRSEKIEKHFSSGRYMGVKIRFSHEIKPLGTAGCVKKAADGFTDDFIVISGDAICDFELEKALALNSILNSFWLHCACHLSFYAIP